jgi:hypothetical protein
MCQALMLHFIFFGSTRVWTQGSVLARETPYCSSQSSGLVIFRQSLVIFAYGSAQTMILLPIASGDVARMTGMYHHTYLLRWGLYNSLPRLALNLYPSNICVLSKWDCRYEPPYLALLLNLYSTLWKVLSALSFHWCGNLDLKGLDKLTVTHK